MKTLRLFVEVDLWKSAQQDERAEITKIHSNKLDDLLLVKHLKFLIHNNQIKK